ncbi:unnamed protein product [Anisakis simplex]|uniref:Ing-related (inferred by orthology to a S. mansoni protein) n=1 Tax=Anisakis simplex TaxID=6269 RepID=A0A0M3K030_ANISI|nr:unnamed protein product [Anisakis simplex]
METTPSVQCGLPPNVSLNAVDNLWERYKPINEYLKKPLGEMLDLDVAYKICLQHLMATKRLLQQKNLTANEINRLLDKVERELVLAQKIAFWKRDVLISTDRQLFSFTGRKSKPKIEKVVTVKPKVRTKKTVTSNVKDNVRRSERRSPFVVKSKEKDVSAPVVVTPETNVSLTCRTKRKAKEMDNSPENSAATNSPNATSTVPKKRTSGRLVKSSARKKQLANNPINTSASALPTDEPTYCLCEQISFGEMIGCDNEKCLVEWFHFECVQLKVKPKGKWYCPLCRGDRFNVLKSSLAR